MKLSRREALGGGIALGIAAATRTSRAATRTPVAYVSHGSPMLAIDKVRGGELRTWGASIAKPRGIVVMTPHYASRHFELGATGRGFAVYSLPNWLKRQLPQDLDYASPPSEGLAVQIESLVRGTYPVSRGERRGFDHTTWMPLMHMFPAADVPVLEMAYPYVKEAELLALGRKLAPLRDDGILFIASGGMTHNLASIDLAQTVSVPSWSSDFDAWATDRLTARDVDALVDWRAKAPSANLAHPDDGAHFRVLLVAMGIAIGSGGAAPNARFPLVGFESTLSNRCVELA